MTIDPLATDSLLVLMHLFKTPAKTLPDGSDPI